MRASGLLALALTGVLFGGCSLFGLGSKGGKFTAHSESVFHLPVGTCLNPPSKVQAEVSSLEAIDCQAPHTQQVFALVNDNAGANYPGAQALQTFANAKCLQHFDAFVGVPYQQSSLFYTYLLPSVRSWAAGDRTVTCVVTTTGLKLTASVAGSKR